MELEYVKDFIKELEMKEECKIGLQFNLRELKKEVSRFEMEPTEASFSQIQRYIGIVKSYLV